MPEHLTFPNPKRIGKQMENPWAAYAQLHKEYKPLSLGMGYADYVASQDFNDILAKVVTNSDNALTQYTQSFGHTRLVKALATLYGKVLDRDIDASNEVLVTAGAVGALYTAIMGNVDDGDEVIVIEPFFDSYAPIVQMAGGTVHYIQLKMASEWENGSVSSSAYVLDDDDLRSAFNEKTKMIIVNTPNNPVGKMFSREELQKIADLCEKFNVICVSDEVYEWFNYGDTEHVRMCSLPGMWDRTITLASAGKTFSMTGWRIGYVYGSAALLQNMKPVHHCCVFACPTPLQEALAIIFEREIEHFDTPKSFFKTISAELRIKRDYMVKELRDIGMKVVVPQGGYFMIIDWSDLEFKSDLSTETDATKDFRFTKWLIKNVGVLAMPTAVFFNDDNKAAMETCARVCFFKQDANLEEAISLLRKWVSK